MPGKNDRICQEYRISQSNQGAQHFCLVEHNRTSVPTDPEFYMTVTQELSIPII